VITLVEFLRDRLAETEQAARAAGGVKWRARDSMVLRIADEGEDCDFRIDSEGIWNAAAETVRPNLAAHIALHDPARVLAEVDAKRRIIDLHPPYADDIDGTLTCPTCIVNWEAPEFERWPCPTLRLLALPWAGHDDWQEEWRP